jgi:putative transposase
LLTEVQGIPLAVAVEGANRHDTAHIRARREEADAKKNVPGYRARRMVVERTHSWLNRFRRLLIRWNTKVENHLALLRVACAWITFRAAWVVG